MMDIITNCSIVSVPFSDHRGCSISIQESDIKRGNGYWKFNNSLLQDINYIGKMNMFLDEYHGKYEDAQLDWEILKIQIK